MNYLSVSQTAEKWGSSTRRIQVLCGEERMPGAMRVGAFWVIPEDAPKRTQGSRAGSTSNTNRSNKVRRLPHATRDDKCYDYI